jgi:6-phosphogluconolactonase
MTRRVERIRVAAEKLPALAAGEIAAALARAARDRGKTSLCLAGGTTPKATYQALASDAAVPWSSVFVYFGDERAVPPENEDSNYRMAREALFERVPLPAGNIYRIPAEQPDQEAVARAYDLVLPDALDVLVLGIGEDGHTASLFPNSAGLAEVQRRVVPVIGPKPPPQRISVTPAVLAAARLVLVLASGRGKAEAVARALEGELAIESCPAQLVRDAVWLMDHEAASGLSGAWP